MDVLELIICVFVFLTQLLDDLALGLDLFLQRGVVLLLLQELLLLCVFFSEQLGLLLLLFLQLEL